ncbi:Pimeloyl-ACP methyl ester carboxylesterase [Devosia lucknowensis]|uniref:Pimeloyl-ACP methyl ester carboxylesterase n=1 Tax=Devosia lucknowensis TaxID=1096929 RepID=A0A1Y6F691_9HYPH|nr:alpha/beta hydrolase [Devosia lucknowensis]SMQ70059.1 Pimeloyl-ACP methyl ester carboxylesterase [Devosia lucknowensis]
MTAEEFSIDIGGATLAGIEQGDGLPVVFLHAGVCDKRMWLDQMAAVSEAGWHAIAYDRRGYGETVSPDEPFNHLEDLEALLDALDIHAAVLVGCSMGGGLAVDFALANPGRVLGLTLIGTSVTGAPWTSTADERAIELAEEDAWERGDLDLLNKVQAHEWLDGPRCQSGRVGGSVRALFLDMNAKALNKPELTQEEKRPDAWGRVDQINAPTLLVVGDEDFTALVDRHETLSETMPNAFAVVLEGAAHIPSIEKPELVNSLLLQFLDAFEGDVDDDDDASDE